MSNTFTCDKPTIIDVHRLGVLNKNVTDVITSIEQSFI